MSVTDVQLKWEGQSLDVAVHGLALAKRAGVVCTIDNLRLVPQVRHEERWIVEHLVEHGRIPVSRAELKSPRVFACWVWHVTTRYGAAEMDWPEEAGEAEIRLMWALERVAELEAALPSGETILVPGELPTEPGEYQVPAAGPEHGS